MIIGITGQLKVTFEFISNAKKNLQSCGYKTDEP